MKLTIGGGQLSRATKAGAVCCLLLTACCQLACSVPNLEKPQCTEARNTLKRFYSLHFGGDMKPSPENLKAREMFLTRDLFNMLSMSSESSVDYFTSSSEYPRAFRVGECSSESENSAALQVLLLWRDDTLSEQKEIRVDTVRTGDTWLINKVSN